MSRNFELLCQLQRERDLFHRVPLPASRTNQEIETSASTGIEKRLFELAPPEADALAASDSLRLPVPIQNETCNLVQQLFLGTGGASLRAVVFSAVDKEIRDHSIAAQVADLLTTYTQDSICLVDANLPGPSLHRYFGAENKSGLAGALVDSGPIGDFTTRIRDGSLHLMPAGAVSKGTNLSAILASGRLRARVSELMTSYSFLVINAPPADSNLMTPYLAALTDGLVLIVEPHLTPRKRACRAKETVRAAGGRVLGVVFQEHELKFSSWTQASRKTA